MPCLYSSCVRLYNLLLCSMRMYRLKSQYKHPAVKQKPILLFAVVYSFYDLFLFLAQRRQDAKFLKHILFLCASAPLRENILWSTDDEPSPTSGQVLSNKPLYTLLIAFHRPMTILSIIQSFKSCSNISRLATVALKSVNYF